MLKDFINPVINNYRLMFSVGIEDSAELIDAIIGYFKAWEYFLIR